MRQPGRLTVSIFWFVINLNPDQDKKQKVKAIIAQKKTEERKQKMIEYIESMRRRNPDVYYPDALAEGTTKDIIAYDIKMYQKQKDNKGNLC